MGDGKVGGETTHNRPRPRNQHLQQHHRRQRVRSLEHLLESSLKLVRRILKRVEVVVEPWRDDKTRRKVSDRGSSRGLNSTR